MSTENGESNAPFDREIAKGCLGVVAPYAAILTAGGGAFIAASIAMEAAGINALNTDPKLAAAAVAIYVAGSILDMKSTDRFTSAIREADKLEVEHGIFEANPFIPDKPTRSQLFRGRKVVLDYTFAAISPVVPAFGFGIGVARGTAYFLNQHQNRKLRERIDIKKEE